VVVDVLAAAAGIGLGVTIGLEVTAESAGSLGGHPVARSWWIALWLGTLIVVAGARIGLPVWRSLRHQVRVAGVTPEGPGVLSILLRGRKLDRIPVAGGQFFQWRFLRRGLCWQAHPYSLSAAPSGDLLRVTVKHLGDHSAGLARLAPGTRVAIEGPYTQSLQSALDKLGFKAPDGSRATLQVP
jgi:predicted ferric reductase